jgi:hypothetical protein
VSANDEASARRESCELCGGAGAGAGAGDPSKWKCHAPLTPPSLLAGLAGDGVGYSMVLIGTVHRWCAYILVVSIGL